MLSISGSINLKILNCKPKTNKHLHNKHSKHSQATLSTFELPSLTVTTINKDKMLRE